MTVLIALAALTTLLVGGSASAQSPQVPLGPDSDKGTVYVEPAITSTEKSMEAHGATVGVRKSDGAGAYMGVDTASDRPTYSVGGSTGGDVSFSAGATSDGKASAGVKAGVTIRY